MHAILYVVVLTGLCASTESDAVLDAGASRPVPKSWQLQRGSSQKCTANNPLYPGTIMIRSIQ